VSQDEWIDIAKMKAAQREFVQEREWDQFHSPKNLASALSVEASELLEIFQWMKESDSQNLKDNDKTKQAVSDELADVFYYLLRIADRLEIDLNAAFWSKLQKSKDKYPIEKARGHSKKYTELDGI
jgi:dCTP diphosphatase